MVRFYRFVCFYCLRQEIDRSFWKTMLPIIWFTKNLKKLKLLITTNIGAARSGGLGGAVPPPFESAQFHKKLLKKDKVLKN